MPLHYIRDKSLPWRTRFRNISLRILLNLAALSVEAFLAVLCLLAGLPILLAPATLTPGSIVALLPRFVVYMWGFCLTTGGMLTLTGVVLSSRYIEQAGVVLLAAAAGVYGLAVLLIAWPATFILALTYFMFALAMYGRYWILNREIKIAKRDQ